MLGILRVPYVWSLCLESVALCLLGLFKLSDWHLKAFIGTQTNTSPEKGGVFDIPFKRRKQTNLNSLLHFFQRSCPPKANLFGPYKASGNCFTIIKSLKRTTVKLLAATVKSKPKSKELKDCNHPKNFVVKMIKQHF